MMHAFARYFRWLHGQWPAGTVEALPVVGDGGVTNVPGIRVVGDLSGIPLLKFSSQTGSQAILGSLAEANFDRQRRAARARRAADAEAEAEADGGSGRVIDVAIIGGGVSGVSAAIEAKKAGLDFVLFEASELFSTVINFPKGKPIFTYPSDLTPAGGIQYGERSKVKEGLLEEMREQVEAQQIEVTRARIDRIERSRRGGEFLLHHGDAAGTVTRALRVVVAIGRSGNFRKLGSPGDDLDKVSNRLHDPRDFCGKKILVVGGGDTAMETAIALTTCGSEVTLSYRGEELTRPKPENVARVRALARDSEAALAGGSPNSKRVTAATTTTDPSMPGDAAAAGTLQLALGTTVQEITPTAVTLLATNGDGDERTLPNDNVFAMIGREAPLDFFRRSGIAISGDRHGRWWVTALLMLLAMSFVYHWKKGGTWLGIHEWAREAGIFPFRLGDWWMSLGEPFTEPASLLGTFGYVAGDPGFWYSLAYCIIIIVFGFRRIRRRRTPYVTRQTVTLATVQVVPLFLLPYLILPWLGFHGVFDAGVGKGIADTFFPAVDYGSGREYWRAFGLILAWPLFFWNVFTDQPLWGWLIVSFLQTFVLIPIIVRRWGKGAYCGWICSCGALAETLGDAHRHKMPHGPRWNQLNMIGQIFLWLAFAILAFRLLAWAQVPWVKDAYQALLYGTPGSYTAMPWSYVWFVDLLWAGILGVALYFHFSGRVWCRFACPLAALMHLYARFGKFRIFADKKKCISCNVCTTVCHQGIDVMNFANKGLPMEDPQCVRCSACVQQCPTGVLSFGRIVGPGGGGRGGEEITRTVLDRLSASPVQIREARAGALGTTKGTSSSSSTAARQAQE